MVMMKTKYFLLTAVATLLLTTACNKVSPIGVLVAGTGVEDRVEMSSVYYQKYLDDKDFAIEQTEDEYKITKKTVVKDKVKKETVEEGEKNNG